MARPRDIRFYEEPLGVLPENQQWLIEYHDNSRKLVEYLTENGAGCNAYHSAIRCVTLLREYLIGTGEAYASERALKWYAQTGPIYQRIPSRPVSIRGSFLIWEDSAGKCVSEGVALQSEPEGTVV